MLNYGRDLTPIKHIKCLFILVTFNKSSRSQVFYSVAILKDSPKLSEKYLRWSAFLIKLLVKIFQTASVASGKTCLPVLFVKSSRSQMLYKIGVLENFVHSQENTCAGGCRPATPFYRKPFDNSFSFMISRKTKWLIWIT